ncbi:MAG: GGDEF domain-containing protein [Planctomycetota bacterium]
MEEARSATLLAKLKNAKRLPSPPGTALQVLELARNEDSTIQSIADTIMSDPALSTRLLKYANSSIIAAPRAVLSVQDAVLVLGLRSVKMTALGFSLVTPERQIKCPGFDLCAFWTQSFATASIARRICAELLYADREQAFTTGLLSGIGRLAFAQAMPDDYAIVMAKLHDDRDLLKIENEVLGTDHVQFGALLLEDWGLPEMLVEAVRLQSQPFDQNRKNIQQALGQTVGVATRLSPLFFRPNEISPQECAQIQHIVKDQLQVPEEVWQRIAGEIMSDYRQVSELFNVQLDSQATVFDLYAEAQEEVTRVGMVTQVERLQVLEENKSLRHQATTDRLTGIANRVLFEEHLTKLANLARLNQRNFAVLILDIDHFKKFNDTYGHDTGDLVLKTFAQTVFETLRKSDLLARYGGEEFVALVACTDRREACIVAARICKTVEKMRVSTQGQKLKVTVSIGVVTTFDYHNLPSEEQLVTDADKQLYLSKERGRNTWSYLDHTASQTTEPVATG